MPTFRLSLLSINQLDPAGYTSPFGCGKCSISSPSITITGNRVNNLYIISPATALTSTVPCMATMSTSRKKRNRASSSAHITVPSLSAHITVPSSAHTLPYHHWVYIPPYHDRANIPPYHHRVHTPPYPHSRTPPSPLQAHSTPPVQVQPALYLKVHLPPYIHRPLGSLSQRPL
jgi:hypothetical protein